MKVARLPLLATLALTLLAAPLAAEAQQGKIYRIGVLGSGSPSDPGAPKSMARFRSGLRDAGYVEGQNITIDWRWLEGMTDRLPILAAELVALKPDVLVSAFRPGIRALKQATPTIPIVMAGAGDPVGAGFIASFARPGGSITGVTSISPDLDGKRLEILKQAVPRVSRIASLWEMSATWPRYTESGFDVAARTLGLQVLPVNVQSVQDLPVAFQTAMRERANALFVDNSPFVATNRAQVAELAIKHGLPWVGQDRMYPEAGALMSYGTDWDALTDRAVLYVARIIKGANPAELPVEQPTKFELVINLKTAKALGLTIPPSVLARADEVIQ